MNQSEKRKNKKFCYSILFKLELILIIIFINFGYSFSQQIESKDTTEYKPKKYLKVKNPVGTEFWLCFMKNYKEDKRPSQVQDLILELFITGDEDSKVKIEIDGIGYRQNVNVPAGTVQNVRIPAEAQVKSDQVLERLAVHITSDKPVSVYGLNRRFQTTDTYLALPTEVLGTEYRAMCYTVSDGLMPQIAIVATENNTEVEITPSANLVLHRKGVPFKVQLKKGDVYQFASLFEVNSDCDLTGTLIKSNKKIAVFSGHQCAYVTPKIIACNHLVEQMPPLPSWGRHFYLGRFDTRSNYTFRVLANENQTRVFLDAKLIRTLGSGEFWDSTLSRDIQITANKPILVAQYSQGFKNGDSIGDPMMLLVSPTQQFLQQYRFATPVNGSWKHRINVVVPTAGIKSMKLNGEPIDPKLFKPLGLSRYSIAYIPIPYGSHFIEGDLPFGMYSYGFGFDRDAFDAYGTMAGQSFQDYEPANDTLPPMAEESETFNLMKVIFRDDRVDDSGIKLINVIENMGLKIQIPRIEEGSPQVEITVRPDQPGVISRAFVEAVDLAGNKSVFTICYTLDNRTQRYYFYLTQGKTESCFPDPGFQIGAFVKVSGFFHSADFSSSGDIAAQGKFGESFGTGGLFGIYFGRKFTNDFAGSARLSIEKYGGTLDAPDSVIKRVRMPNGDLKPFQETRLLRLNGVFIHLGLSGEYFFNQYSYAFGGLNFAFNLSKSIELQRQILIPDNFTYTDGTRTHIDPEDAQTLSSLSFLRLGLLAGLGLTYPINHLFSAYVESQFIHHLGNVINDGTWGLNQLSIQAGIRYRFFP
ncbi:MAG: IgGFc-binding protein [Candidatus Kapabacteria bacterium]|nr:IgGFc-binding protein [Candidatus Kapabacteria bacterium]